jgi:hypothetical protein
MSQTEIKTNRIFVITSIILILLVLAFFVNMYVRHTFGKIYCSEHMITVGKGIFRYAEDFNGKYPSPEEWCDLLIKKEYLRITQFSHFRKGGPIQSYYAINPLCNINCPNDVVLVFETKPGWNQHGGPELLSFNNHWGKGANVLFNNGDVEFIKLEDVNKLKWKPDEPNYSQTDKPL